jgi:hypothetical protein
MDVCGIVADEKYREDMTEPTCDLRLQASALQLQLRSTTYPCTQVFVRNESVSHRTCQCTYTCYYMRHKFESLSVPNLANGRKYHSTRGLGITRITEPVLGYEPTELARLQNWQQYTSDFYRWGETVAWDKITMSQQY